MLQKLAVPRGVHFVAVEPIHHKFWQQRFGILFCDAGQSKGVIDRHVGLPVSWYPSWLRAVMYLTSMT